MEKEIQELNRKAGIGAVESTAARAAEEAARAVQTEDRMIQRPGVRLQLQDDIAQSQQDADNGR